MIDAGLQAGAAWDIDHAIAWMVDHLGVNEASSPESAQSDPNAALPEPLTERELDVLPLMVQGLSYQQMADKLFLAKGIIKTHVSNIYGKLGVQNRAEAIHKAQELGLA